ncbi:hypothetical protein J2857_005272 [Neorhizobium galegae]|uniref:hypothetical protein n=1 Tax=Neorhizobium galegae TaxID=399 RepID=UPI001AE2CDD4|nr:hypothetical protein [Neorhizobium galegae]MBP2562481.1 hypothetical protein [Neorhizobium galegae]
MNNPNHEQQYEFVATQLERFRRRLQEIEDGEHIFSAPSLDDPQVDITLNEKVRYSNMIRICDLAVALLKHDVRS